MNYEDWEVGYRDGFRDGLAEGGSLAESAETFDQHEPPKPLVKYTVVKTDEFRSDNDRSKNNDIVRVVLDMKRIEFMKLHSIRKEIEE